MLKRNSVQLYVLIAKALGAIMLQATTITTIRKATTVRKATTITRATQMATAKVEMATAAETIE